MRSTFSITQTLLFFCLLFLVGCIEPFAPPEVANAPSYLVIDGFLNAGTGPSRIQLSRTQRVSDNNLPQPELFAQVSVEGDLGSNFAFTDTGNGIYYLDAQILNPSEQFRLRITTAGGNEYLSEYTQIKVTPKIDSLVWRADPSQNGVQISLNTQDPSNQTRFYRWKYEETWEYRSTYQSLLEVIDGRIQTRKQDIYTCWKTERASNILLNSTIKQSQDILREHPLVFVKGNGQKLLVKYSILVKQYALTQDAFAYWTNLAKTTENTGGLFDPQPSQITGNVRCVNDPEELAFGYFSVTSLEEKRMFISFRDFDFTHWFPNGRTPACDPPDTVSYGDAINTSKAILYQLPPPTSDFLVAPPSCTDCRLQGGGVLERPSFW
jgi:hypothetical protein